MKLCMIGTGYVCLVSGVCFSDLGNDVICVDKDQDKINNLKQGIIPIYEPGLEELVLKNYKNKRLKFSTDLNDSVKKLDIVFTRLGITDECFLIYDNKNINSLEVLFRTEQRRRLGVVKNTISRLIELYDKENEGLETNYKLENGHKPELVDCCPFTKNNFYILTINKQILEYRVSVKIFLTKANNAK